MRIPIPFGYEASVLTSGGNRADRKYHETVLVEIAEFAPGDLPGVVTWRGHHPREDAAPVTALAHDGGLYEPATYKAWQDGGHADHAVPADAVAGAVEGVMDEWGHRVQPDVNAIFKQPWATRPYDPLDPYRHKGPPKPASVLESDRDGALEKALSAASDFLSVGGALYRRVAEPLLLAHGKGVWVVGEPGKHPRRNLFRLDDLQAARERAAILGELPLRDVAVPDFVLHRPDLLSEELDMGALVDWVDTLLVASASRMHSLPLALIEAHYDVYETRHPVRVDYSVPAPDPDPAEYVRLGRALAEALLSHDPRDATCQACLHGLQHAAERIPGLDSAPAP